MKPSGSECADAGRHRGVGPGPAAAGADAFRASWQRETVPWPLGSRGASARLALRVTDVRLEVYGLDATGGPWADVVWAIGDIDPGADVVRVRCLADAVSLPDRCRLVESCQAGSRASLRCPAQIDPSELSVVAAVATQARA